MVGLAVASLFTVLPAGQGMANTYEDPVYVSNAADNTVKRLNVQGSANLATFVDSTHGLDGPMGLLFNRSSLLLANQNVNLPQEGQILRYSSKTGSFQAELPTSPKQPPAPRGMIVTSGRLIVASPICDPAASDLTPGVLQEFDVSTGHLLAQYPKNCLSASSTFHPRGVVLGPDGYIYVSNDPNGPTGNGGQVLRFSPDPRKLPIGPADSKPFIDCAANCTYDLNRPEGLVFNPAESQLYVTSFKNTGNPNSNDKILIFDRRGRQQDRIDLDKPGADRAYAQALMFGPSGRLYVPIFNTGQLRRYDVSTRSAKMSQVVAPGTMAAPTYLIFGRTNPATLAYDRP
jgi:DNA-binding beta-propeller fold protein YncE